ncbi:MAG: DNA-3-methyladenine glycosylase family protein [Bacillota bacterium]|nr:DNA-3-methyladenine glycosylase [Bacillota bacterium]HPT61868.1 DNA-3-methyladenine glycosylase [Bacillota bacterium]
MKKHLRTTPEIKEFLIEADSKFSPIISAVGDIEVELEPDLFVSLVSTIVGQQLSNKVLEIIWNRFDTLLQGEVTPEKILNLPDEKIREVGISYRKIEYIKNLAQKVLNGELDLVALESFSDQEVIEKLVELKGIGVWTAEMLLIFSLGRNDVFSVRDLGLRRGVARLYDLGDVSDDEVAKIAAKWSPYRTFASLYLWRYFSS